MSEAPTTAEDARAETIRLLRDSAAAVAPPGGDTARVRGLRYGDPGFNRATWQQMGELGWIGLRVPEAAGGAGLGLGALCALAEELGGGLAPEPLIPCTLSATLLAAAGDTTWLPRLLAGEAVVLTAWQDRADTLEVATAPDATRVFIPQAAGGDAFLVPVREGARTALHVIPRADADLRIERTQDGGNYGTLRLHHAPGHGPGTHLADDVGAVLEAALDEAALATAASLLGTMERAFALTLDHLRTRHQFGKPIGAFQALQHRAADLRMAVALTRASVGAAAATLDAGCPPERRRAVTSRAKARAAEAAMLVTRQAVQLHGGVGYTDEYEVGLHLRRAMVLAPAFGGAATHRRRFMAAAPEETEE